MGQAQPAKAKSPRDPTQADGPLGAELLGSQTLPNVTVSQDAEIRKLQRRWLEINVASAEAAYEAAKTTTDSLTELGKRGAVSQRESLTAQADLTQKEAQLERAKILLELFELQAKRHEDQDNRGETTPNENSYNRNDIPNPFGHDAKGYRYLRGLAAYNDRSQTWSILYDDKPSRDDKYGGVITLADHRRLTMLKEHDVVYVEGHISNTLKDDLGKPLYVIDHLNKLKPR
jgi:hypothetical protein